MTDPSHLGVCVLCGRFKRAGVHARSQAVVTVELKFVLKWLGKEHVCTQEYCGGGEVVELGLMAGVFQV